MKAKFHKSSKYYDDFPDNIIDIKKCTCEPCRNNKEFKYYIAYFKGQKISGDVERDDFYYIKDSFKKDLNKILNIENF